MPRPAPSCERWPYRSAFRSRYRPYTPSLPRLATRQCRWHDSRNTRGASTPVLVYELSCHRFERAWNPQHLEPFESSRTARVKLSRHAGSLLQLSMVFLCTLIAPIVAVLIDWELSASQLSRVKDRLYQRLYASCRLPANRCRAPKSVSLHAPLVCIRRLCRVSTCNAGGPAEAGVVAVQKGNLSMNRQIFVASLVATLGATLALASAAALAAKPTQPGGGGTADQCAAGGLDFPAFAFWRPAGKCEGDFCRGFNRQMRSLGTQVEHFPWAPTSSSAIQ